MNVRAFEWRDMVDLHHYRSQCIYLDSGRVLTKGPIFVPTGALLSSLTPGTGFFTALAWDEESSRPLYGQASHKAGAAAAQITFLTPVSALAHSRLSALVEFLAVPLGERGAMHLVAEAEEHSEVQRLLRQVGFGIYARQRIWRLNQTDETAQPGLWRAARRSDEAAIRFLYANLVPGLVQQVETLPANHLQGLVYYRGNELLAYVDIFSGINGVYAVPYVHPDAEHSAEQLVSLLGRMPGWRNRPVFVCVRSYQAWLEGALEEMQAQPGQYQAVMVRRLAVRRMVPVLATVSNGNSAENTLPVARIQ